LLSATGTGSERRGLVGWRRRPAAGGGPSEVAARRRPERRGQGRRSKKPGTNHYPRGGGPYSKPCKGFGGRRLACGRGTAAGRGAVNPWALTRRNNSCPRFFFRWVRPPLLQHAIGGGPQPCPRPVPGTDRPRHFVVPPYMQDSTSLEPPSSVWTSLLRQYHQSQFVEVSQNDTKSRPSASDLYLCNVLNDTTPSARSGGTRLPYHRIRPPRNPGNPFPGSVRGGTTDRPVRLRLQKTKKTEQRKEVFLTIVLRNPGQGPLPVWHASARS